MTLIPAYGREYKSKKEVLADWDAGKDFIVADMFSRWDGKPANRDSFKGELATVQIRYARLTKVCVAKVPS